MEKQKQLAIEGIDRAIKNAIKLGFKVVVASDEEGNNWNELNPNEYAMFYDNKETKPEMIVLGVYRSVDEDEVFRDFELCEGCGEELLEGQAISGERHSACT
jgi:hypothetical protein